VLCFLLAFPPLRRLFGGRELGALALGLAIAVAAAAAYRLSAKVRALGSVAALGSLVFPALFLVQDDIRELLGREHGPGADESAGVAIRLDAPLVILLFDELPLLSLLDPSFDIDRASFPSFARLRDRSTWFRNFTTNHEETVGAVPALLTGRWVRGLQAPVREHYPESLFTLIARDQLRAVHEHTTRLAPELEGSGERERGLEPILRDLVAVYGHLVLPRALTGALPEVSRTWGDFWQSPATTSVPEPCSTSQIAWRETPSRGSTTSTSCSPTTRCAASPPASSTSRRGRAIRPPRRGPSVRSSSTSATSSSSNMSIA
jgi:hypothetical protein